MDPLAIGFAGVVATIMIAKWLLEFKMYRSSVYKMLYSGYTEYRMRRKSVRRMSESVAMQEQFGDCRLIFQVLRSDYVPASFVTVILRSGCYVFGVTGSVPPRKDSLQVCHRFFQENIAKKLAGTPYQSEALPVAYTVVVPDSSNIAQTGAIVKRGEMIEWLKQLDSAREKVLSAEDVQHIFSVVAKEALAQEQQV